MPANWILNGQTSTGSNWIAGSNSVTVTSDAVNGIGGDILVRPVNSCGSGLQNGQAPVSIPINRPAPTLSITGNQDLCSGTSTYTLNGLPAGATVTWSLSGTTYASIPTPSTGTTVDVTRLGSYNTSVILFATVTDCIQTYPPVRKTIILGSPSVLTGSVPYKYWYGDPNNDYNDVCRLQTINTDMQIVGASSVIWSRTAASPTNTSWSQMGNNINFYFWAVNQTAVFRINASNSCGSTLQSFGFRSIDCGGGGTGGCDYYTVSPNPANGSLKVVVPNIPPPCPLRTAGAQNVKTSALSISTIKLYDMGGNIRLVKKVASLKEATLNLAGIKPGAYYIEITDGKQQYTENNRF